MWRRLLLSTAALAALIALGVAAFSEDLPLPPKKVYEQQFPEGEGKAIAERSCLICHSATLVTQQAKDSTAWEKTLGTMEKWGVKLTPAEHDTLRTYLVTHLGQRKR